MENSPACPCPLIACSFPSAVGGKVTSMPEIRECLAFYHIARNWFERAQKDEQLLHIQCIWADAADSNHSETKLTKDGLPFVLPNTSTIKRGNKGSQYPLFPPTLRMTKRRPDPPALNTYQLFEVDKTMRSLILGFRQDPKDGGRTLYGKVRCI